jgi:hypothetical protein
MAQPDAQAWWAEVEHLRERIERRRGESPSGGHSRVRPTPVSHRVERDGRDGRGYEPSFAARRTVRIRGQAIPTVTAPRLRPVEESARRRDAGVQDFGQRPARRRPRTPPAERLSASPDRLALWAFAFALLVLLVAALSAHGL